MGSEEILTLIEQFEGSFDMFQQILQKHKEEIIQNMSAVWKKMKNQQDENEKLKEKISKQNSELTRLRTESDGLNKKIEELKTKKDELTSKNTELNTNLEKITSDLKKPEFELERLISNLKDVNEKIKIKESEKTTLDQAKINNENRENQLKSDHTKRMEDIEVKIVGLKRKNFFTNFIIENSEQEIHEVDIIATIMERGKCQLDDLKKQLSVPPIMGVRSIKQLAVKGIINLNEDTNEITMP